jgi:hypothetical protein
MRERPSEYWGRQLRDWVEAAGRKTEELARISQQKVELVQIDWDLLRRRADLGNRFLRLLEQGEFAGWASDPALSVLVESVRSLERKRRSKEEEIEDIRGQGRPRGQPGP